MITIDLNKIRKALPKRAKVEIKKTKGGNPFIEYRVMHPGLCEKGTKEEYVDLKQVFDWQREIIGSENIQEFYVEETGAHWSIYLKKQPIEFLNASDTDVNSFVNINLIAK